MEKNVIKKIIEHIDITNLFYLHKKLERQIVASELYGVGLLDMKVVDPFVYKGKGRPKKTDYCTIMDLQKKVNTNINARWRNR